MIDKATEYPLDWDLGPYGEAVNKRIWIWREQDVAGRILRKDPTVWAQDAKTPEIADRLGWLHLPKWMRKHSGELLSFAEEIRDDGYRHVVVLGMGGSSLAPAVFQETFSNARGYPELSVLDSTHPDAIRTLSRKIDPAKTLFLVSSKSGTTIETSTLFCYFWRLVGEQTKEPGRNFAAITDPQTPLERMAGERHFRRVFLGPTDVGGRYSALSVFGLLPAALIGIDIDRLLERALEMADACLSCADPAGNPGLMLGAALGELGMSGRDKITFVTGRELSLFPLWLEQLIAESTGKNGKGLIPIAGEKQGHPEAYGNDRLFVGIALEKPGAENDGLDELRAAGHPVVRIRLRELTELGQEFFLWELAVTAAGATLGINPFDQPDVQLAKDLARKAMESAGSGHSSGRMLSVDRKQELSDAVCGHLKELHPGDYVAIQAYLNPDSDTHSRLEQLRNGIRDRNRVATTAGYGPRFLHSTGQLHKGGPGTGLFLQLLDRPSEDLEVPEHQYTFGRLIRAQADGDYQALKDRNRRVIRIDLGGDPAAAIAELQSMI